LRTGCCCCICRLGSHGAAKHVQLIAFPTHAQAAAFLRNDLNCSVIFGLLGPLPGGEQPCSLITTTDTSLVTFSIEKAGAMAPRFTSLPLDMLQIPNHGNIAVAFSKHQRGLPLPLAAVCDTLLHVPHHRCDDRQPERGVPTRPLLDDVACFSILLHQLTLRSGYNEHSIVGHKYDVSLTGRQRQQEDLAEKRRAERTQRDKETQEAWNGDDHNGLEIWAKGQGDY
jgi:hypothetical protein